MAPPQDPHLRNSHTHTQGNIFPTGEGREGGRLEGKTLYVFMAISHWAATAAAAATALYIDTKDLLFAHHQVCIKKIGTKNKAKKSDKKGEP